MPCSGSNWTTVHCIQTLDFALFDILVHNSVILYAVHTKHIPKCSPICADQKSYDCHVTKMAAEEKTFRILVRLIISAGL